MFVFFVFDKNCLIKSCSSFEDASVNKISWSHVDWCKFCIHLRSLNVRHFGMLEGTVLISTASRYDLPTEFHKNLPIGSKVIWGGGTHGDLISLTFLFKESRLKNVRVVGSWPCQVYYCQSSEINVRHRCCSSSRKVDFSAPTRCCISI
jgi:hypothetical protein